MAKKNRRPRSARPSAGARPRATRPNPGELPDRRVMEGVMRKHLAEITGRPVPTTPLDEAQTLMHDAFEAKDPQRKVQLAQKALAISGDCADAYVLLAEHAQSRKETLRLYEQGIAAGERALGPEAFERDAGNFWGILETRPYMRARKGLAHALWCYARRDEAVGHLEEMLRLNSNDNQGLRYSLTGYYLFMGRDDDLARLLDKYPNDGSASWAYTRALLAFRRCGETPEADAFLKKAIQVNKYVLPYLLEKKMLPVESPSSYSPGADSEAQVYVHGDRAGWKYTPGAIAWLRAKYATKKRQTGASQGKGPLDLIKKWLKDRLSKEDDIWQADIRQLPNWLQIGGEKVRPWMIMVTSRSRNLVLAAELLEDKPAPALVWDTLVKAMQAPAGGRPRRPVEVQVTSQAPWQTLKSHIEEIGCRFSELPVLDQLDFIFAEMSERFCGKPMPGFLDVRGITPPMVAGFYDAAVHYFEQTLWRHVESESVIRVSCDMLQSGPWHAVVMGQSGLTNGLALYDDLELLRRQFAGGLDGEKAGRQAQSYVLSFEEEPDVPVADVEAAKLHGWKVARPDAYPSLIRKERGMSLRQPLAWEMKLMEGCLRAFPEFVQRRKFEDCTPEEITVPVAGGTLKLELSWVPE